MTASPAERTPAPKAPDLFTSKVAVYGPKLIADFGLTATQAAGAFGNIGHECGGFRLMQEIAPTVKGSRGGYGWAQWTGPRRVKFEAYCTRNGLNPASDAANYAYLFLELKGDEAAAIAALKKASTLSAATDAFCRSFERPGVVNLPSRMVWAQKALDAIQGSPVAVAPPLPPAPSPPAPPPAPASPPRPQPAPSGGLSSAPSPAPTRGFFERIADRLRAAYPVKG